MFCNRLKTARLAAGMSQKQLGIAIGLDEFVASTRIDRYELGIHEADLGTVSRLATVLRQPCAYFFADSDSLAEMISIFGTYPPCSQRELLAVMKHWGPAK